MDYSDYISRISFRFIEPHMPLPGGLARFVQWLGKRGIPLEINNTLLPGDALSMKSRLREICAIPKMSTFAIGAMINKGVEQMSADEAFVNVGVWHGFTFLSGMIGNSQKKCIGVDNFSRKKLKGAREGFPKRFDKYKSSNHHFCEMDFAQYFAQVHSGPIGFYVYDGKHTYENQLKGLRLAEPFFSPGSLILIDDSNLGIVRQATLDFLSASPCRYRMILDKTTYCNRHPTFWNGIIVLQKIG